MSVSHAIDSKETPLCLFSFHRFSQCLFVFRKSPKSSPPKSSVPIKPLTKKKTSPAKNGYVQKYRVEATKIKGDLAYYSGFTPTNVGWFVSNLDPDFSKVDGGTFVGIFNELNEKGEVIKRNPNDTAKNYLRQGVLYSLNTSDGDSEEEDLISSLGTKVAKCHQDCAKPYQGSTINTSYAFCRNEEEKYLVDVIGARGAYEAIVQLYGQYFEENSFTNIEHDIIPIYFKDGNVEEISKHLHYTYHTMVENV